MVDRTRVLTHGELEDTLIRNVNRMSMESDTAAYLLGRQRLQYTIGDWQTLIKRDWRISKG